MDVFFYGTEQRDISCEFTGVVTQKKKTRWNILFTRTRSHAVMRLRLIRSDVGYTESHRLLAWQTLGDIHYSFTLDYYFLNLGSLSFPRHFGGPQRINRFFPPRIRIIRHRRLWWFRSLHFVALLSFDNWYMMVNLRRTSARLARASLSGSEVGGVSKSPAGRRAGSKATSPASTAAPHARRNKAAASPPARKQKLTTHAGAELTTAKS